mgnify:FL=1
MLPVCALRRRSRDPYGQLGAGDAFGEGKDVPELLNKRHQQAHPLEVLPGVRPQPHSLEDEPRTHDHHAYMSHPVALAGGIRKKPSATGINAQADSTETAGTTPWGTRHRTGPKLILSGRQGKPGWTIGRQWTESRIGRLADPVKSRFPDV